MTTWVLLRGLTREARHWGSFVATLAAALPGARLLTIDLPGNGALHQHPSPTAVSGYTEHVRAELTAQGVHGPVHLLAMSLGAMVAIDWAARHPHELAGAVLINTSLRGLSPIHQRLRPGAIAALLGAAIAGGDARRERTVLRVTSRLRADDAALLADWVAWRREHRVNLANTLRQLVAAARFRVPHARPAVPVLVLCGAGDTLVDPRCSFALARRWGATFMRHPEAGHDLPLDDGAWVALQVAAWLSNSQAATAASANSASI